MRACTKFIEPTGFLRESDLFRLFSQEATQALKELGHPELAVQISRGWIAGKHGGLASEPGWLVEVFDDTTPPVLEEGN